LSPMKELVIRDFEERDIEGILDCQEETGRVSFPGLGFDREKAREFLAAHAGKHPGTIRVAEAAGRMAGFIRFQPDEGAYGRYGLINTIFVDSAHRKRGIGRLLLADAERWFRAAGISRVKATVTRTNAPSMGFFSSQGYGQARIVFGKMLGAKG
jgi:ribosomal protein S18 acetylase RimI-like enzyme